MKITPDDVIKISWINILMYLLAHVHTLMMDPDYIYLLWKLTIIYKYNIYCMEVYYLY